MVEQTCGQGYINQEGEWLIDPQFCTTASFSEGLAAVALKTDVGGMFLWGFVDKEGELVIDTKYLLALDFSNGLARVLTPDGQSGYINKDGRWVLLDN